MSTKARLSAEVVAALLKGADAARRSFAETLEPRGVTLQQYNVLRILRGAGPDGLPTLEVAERMMEKTPGITRLIDRLEAKRLVARGRADEDRRLVRCRITSRGRNLLASLDAPMDAADDAVVRALSRKDQRALLELLTRLG